MSARKLMAVLAHPDDESMGLGGTLAKYAAEGVELSLVTATPGDAGRWHGHPPGTPAHPGAPVLAAIRRDELRAAAGVLGVRDLQQLDYHDRQLDAAEPHELIGTLTGHIRRFRPDVVVTFGPDGGYGHPDHIAISQFATAAVVAAADPGHAAGHGGGDDAGPPHRVAKLYYLAWPASVWTAFESAFRRLVTTVDGEERQATPWPSWALTTVIDTRPFWPTVWQAISCHASQVSAYERLRDLPAAEHEALWGWQSFYRVFSTVNGGRAKESDLFEGIPS
jgi:LmbE family N-acetylglucosaminyl deacetylase